jgi:hypothetical protein
MNHMSKFKTQVMFTKFLAASALFLFTSFSADAESKVNVKTTCMQQKAYAGGTFVVKIQIERKNLDSYFMVEHELPNGMIATGLESQGALFSFKEGKIKYSWLRIPKEDVIELAYKVKVPFEMIGTQEINGTYYYIENEEKQIFDIPKVGIEIIEHIPTSDTIAEKAILGIILNDENKPEFAGEVKDNIEYKIQILSSTSKLNKDSLRKEFELKDKVKEEYYNGTYKYMAGSFKTYDEAREAKNKMDFARYIPFVVAYNNTTRITVGEAMQKTGKRR